MRLILAAAFALALFAAPVFAQPAADPVVTAGDVTTVTTTAEGDDTTVINTPAGEPTTVETGDNTTVVLPYGDLADKALAWVQTALGAIVATIIAVAFRALPENIVSMLKTLRVEQLLTRAADYGINATREAVKGKTLSVKVGNEVLAKAVQYAIDNGPGFLIRWMGGEAGIREKLIARLPMNDAVGAEDIR